MEDQDLSPAYLETLGIDDFTLGREFGRDRGENPVTTEAQNRAIEKLCQKLYSKASNKPKKEEEEDSINFDVRSKTRVILFEGKVLKRSTNAIVQHSSKRHAVLLNDVLLITSIQSSGGILSSEKLNLHQVLYLNNISVADLKLISSEEDPCAFEIRTPERPYHFSAESESDKKIWLEELEAAIFCIMATTENKRLGWQHEIVLGTIYSAAMKGELELLSRHIDKLVGQSLDTADESGMTALHWASLFGRLEAVEMLVEAGSDVDHLNSGLNSALLLAASGGHDTVAFYLMDQGADIYIRNLKDIDCLLMAVLYGYHRGTGLKNIISALLMKGVSLNKLDSAGAAPLHECAGRNLSWPVQILVDAGADVNIKHGRNGLTPLQMACSNAEPDPETVRSFLDKGAHPNWRDTAKRTAFDLVLCAHQNKSRRLRAVPKMGSSGEPSGEPSGGDVSKETLDEVSEFVQHALPVLMEIVRKGGRYSDESVASLRPSFQDAITTGRELWNKQTSPPNFSQFLALKAENSEIIKPSWTADSASPHCLLCVDKFTYSNRRHHCRGCGILCCDLCSMKRLVFKTASTGGSSGGSSPAPAVSSPSAKAEGSRACDGCFNKFTFECNTWHQVNLKAKREQEKMDQQMRLKDGAIDKRGSPKNSDKRHGDEHLSVASKSVVSVNGSAAAVKSTMSETMKGLEERGAKLQDTAERSEQMVEAASEFNSMTRKLLRQQQQKNNWMGGSS